MEIDESVSKKDDIQDRRLSIIDFSSEDDSLLGFPQENQELRSIELFESVVDNKLESFDDGLKRKELEPQPSECLEPEGVRRNGKYNLRKSLAWDSAFFTCEGVLDAEELSSMTGVEKSEKQMLPRIQEEVHRSTDSISTLGSDTLTLESIEPNLFEDIRASIQKSSKATIMSDESSKVSSRVTDTKIGNASKRMEGASQPKMKPKVACKKPSIGMQNPGRLGRPVSACPQSSQKSIGVGGESTLSLMKRPKVQGKPIPSSTMLAKRASLGGSLLKVEKDMKTAAGRGVPVSKLPGSSRNVPRPILSSKSSSLASSTATTTKATSSFDSSTSISSVKIGKSPSNSMKRTTDTRTSNPKSSSSNPKTPSRISSVNKTGPGKSRFSSQLLPFSKLSSSISPASSISDWSSESVSSISSLQQISCSSRDSIKSSSKRISIDFDAPQSLDSENHTDDRNSIGMVAQLPTSKPSGLRLPSPKIGFFDGVKSAVRTPKRSVQSHPVAPSNLPKIGAGSGNPSGGQIKAKLGNSNFERAVTNGRIPDAQRTSSNTKPKVSTPHDDVKITPVSGRHTTACDLSSISNLKNLPLYQEMVEETKHGELELKKDLPSLEKSNEKEESHSEDQIDCLTRKVSEMDVNGTKEMVLGDSLSSDQNLCSEDNVCATETFSQRELLVCVQKEDSLINLSKPTPLTADENTGMVLGDSLSSEQNLSSEDNVCAPMSFSQRELLVCVQKEDSLINLLKPNPSPTANENTAGKRIPFSVKDSLFNIDGSLDVSKGSTVLEGEKNSQLPFTEGHFDTTAEIL